MFLREASSGKSVKLRGKMTLKNGLQSGFFLEHFRFPVRKKMFRLSLEVDFIAALKTMLYIIFTYYI